MTGLEGPYPSSGLPLSVTDEGHWSFRKAQWLGWGHVGRKWQRLALNLILSIMFIHYITFLFCFLLWCLLSFFFMVFPVRTRSWIMVGGQTRVAQVVENSHSNRATGNRGKILATGSQKVWLTSPAEGRGPDRQVVCVGQDIWHQVHGGVVSILGKQQVAETQIPELPFSVAGFEFMRPEVQYQGRDMTTGVLACGTGITIWNSVLKNKFIRLWQNQQWTAGPEILKFSQTSVVEIVSSWPNSPSLSAYCPGSLAARMGLSDNFWPKDCEERWRPYNGSWTSCCWRGREEHWKCIENGPVSSFLSTPSQLCEVYSVEHV